MNLRTRPRPVVASDGGWFFHFIIVAITLAGLVHAWQDHDERLVALSSTVERCRTEAWSAWDYAAEVELEAAERLALIQAACIAQTVKCQYAMERSRGSGQIKDMVTVHCSRPGGCGLSVDWATSPLAWTLTRKP